MVPERNSDWTGRVMRRWQGTFATATRRFAVFLHFTPNSVYIHDTSGTSGLVSGAAVSPNSGARGRAIASCYICTLVFV